MFKLFIPFLLPLILFSQPQMKCQSGKCGTDKSTMKKDIVLSDEPKKEIKNISKIEKKSQGVKPTVTQLFNVRTVKVKKIIIALKQVNYGYLVAKDSARLDVLTRYSGFIEELYANTLYKKVNKGDALAKVYSPEVYKAKQDYLNSLKYNANRPSPAMLKSAKIKLTLLGIDDKEIQSIRKKGKADTYTTIYAPVSGWIFEKNINQGSSFNSKKRLFEIVNLEEVWMEVKLFQKELEKLDILDDFEVKIEGIKKRYKAKKSLLYPMLNPKEATVTLRLIINNLDGKLKPGMYAKVHATSHEKSRLVIPKTAIIRKNGIWYAFLSTEFRGEYEPVVIKVKPLDNRYYEVLKGLKEEDTVVTNALFMMDSDAQINGVY